MLSKDANAVSPDVKRLQKQHFIKGSPQSSDISRMWYFLSSYQGTELAIRKSILGNWTI